MQADATYSGWLYVLAAGIFQGSFMLPMKWTRGWAWENTWFVFSTVAYLICPWLFVFLTVPNAAGVYASASHSRIALVLAMGALWGVGALTFGLGVDAVGLSLGFAVILGIAACSGTLLPLIMLARLPGPVALTVMIASLLLMLAGVGVCSWAGRWKATAPQPSRTSYRIGILICIASGLLSSAGNIGFVIGQPIIDNAVARGANPNFAPNVVWGLLTISLFLCNTIYSGYRLAAHGTTERFRREKPLSNIACGVLMGSLWMLGFAFYGAGVNRLGKLGPSFGWSAMMCTVVFTANVLGIYSGEWRQAPREAVRQLWTGMGLLLIALVGLGVANRIG